MAAAKGMSLVWLNIGPYQVPHAESAAAASRPARGPAISARRRPNRADPANAGQRGQQVPDGVRIERQQLLHADRDNVEQAAIQIQIPEVKQPLIDKAAGVIGDDHFAVALLHFLVVGDGVVAEGARHQNEQQGDQQRRREIVAVEAVRQTPAVAKGRSFKVGGCGRAHGWRLPRYRLYREKTPPVPFPLRGTEITYQIRT